MGTGRRQSPCIVAEGQAQPVTAAELLHLGYHQNQAAMNLDLGT